MLICKEGYSWYYTNSEISKESDWLKLGKEIHKNIEKAIETGQPIISATQKYPEIDIEESNYNRNLIYEELKDYFCYMLNFAKNIDKNDKPIIVEKSMIKNRDLQIKDRPLRDKNIAKVMILNEDYISMKSELPFEKQISYCTRCNLQNEYVDFNPNYLCYNCKN